MLFEIKHQTLFEYSSPVTESYMEFRLTPTTDSCQRVLQVRHSVSPNRQVRQYLDHLGNTVSHFNILYPHDRVEVTFESVVESFAGSRMPNELRAALGTPKADLQLHDYLQPTHYAKWTPALLGFAGRFEHLRGGPAREVAEQIGNAVFEGFRYDPHATTSASTVEDLLVGGAGVCQDFAHLMIAVCRHFGIPSRYVSGYVFTDASHEGAVASHAWVEVFDHDQGWCGVDPTHNRWVEEHHVRIGVGRDYSDVAPNRGVFRGAAEEQVTVNVFMRELDPSQLEQSRRRFFAAPGGNRFATRQTQKAAPISILQQTNAAAQQQQQQQQ